MSLYRIYNQGEIARFAGACPGEGRGWRSVIALAFGRKWITLLGWTTLETARPPLDLRRRLQPRPRRRLFAASHTRRHQSAPELCQENPDHPCGRRFAEAATVALPRAAGIERAAMLPSRREGKEGRDRMKPGR